jgi:tetratricopeptide (TPR) repeat protein
MPRASLLISCCSLIVVLAATFGVDAQAAEPTESDLELAKAHYRTGELNYDRGDFPDAAKEFEEAYRLSARPELLYNMGKSYDGAGDMRGALVAYRRFLDSVQTSPDRPFVEKRTAELNGLIARLTLTSSIEGANVMLDGERLGVTPLPPAPIELNPGEHSIEISAEGYSTFRKRVTLARSQQQTLDAPLISLVRVIHVREQQLPVYKRWYLWTPIGLAIVAGVVAGAVIGARDANAIHGPSLQLPKVE